MKGEYMNSRRSQSSLPNRSAYSVIAIACVALVVPTSEKRWPKLRRPRPLRYTGRAQEAAPKIPDDQLDSLVAPIALYPDPLLARRWLLRPTRSKSSSSSSG